jgi:glycosyltransferase involved in cell wall biosynthesis
MRIGVDARELCGRATGVGRYLAGLIAEWTTAEVARRHEFVLYAPADIPLVLDTRRFATRHVAEAGATRWEQLRLPRVAAGDHLDVFFAPAYSAPIRLRTPTVVAIHDVSFVAHPEWFRLREGARRRLLSRRSAHTARAVITISEFSRREIIERLGVPSEKIHVIPPGLTRPSLAAADRRPMVLFVGSIFNRRRVPDLIRAFAPIARRHPDASLEIVGDDRSYPREDLRGVAASQGIDARVRWHRYVPEERLRDLYAKASAFAFLSEYEGLGLTPIEALAAGVPPVLLDTAVARESCGSGALYVPIHDLPATTRALESAMFDQDVRRKLLAAAPDVLSRYDWPRAGRDTLAVLEASAG